MASAARLCCGRSAVVAGSALARRRGARWGRRAAPRASSVGQEGRVQRRTQGASTRGGDGMDRRGTLASAAAAAVAFMLLPGEAARAVSSAGDGGTLVSSASGHLALVVPDAFLVAANRPVADVVKAQTLVIATDLGRRAVISVRQEPLPVALRELLERTTSPTPEQAARALTAPLADAVAMGEAKAAVGGVINGETGTVGFELGDVDADVRGGGDGLDAAPARPFFSYEYTAEVCRGKIGAEVRSASARDAVHASAAGAGEAAHTHAAESTRSPR